LLIRMEPSKAAMKAALRVLKSLSDHEKPDQADVDELHWYAPSDRARPLDEVVCDAIQRAMKDREEKRKAIKATLRNRALALNSMQSEPAPEAATPDPRQEYLELCAKLTQLGNELQQATANTTTDSAVLHRITQLLNEHARLTRILTEPRPRERS
jgi:hypothetical protein